MFRTIIRRGFATTAFTAVAVTGLVAQQAVPAAAATAVTVVVQGSGTISPGLNVVPVNQTFTFTSVNITTVGVVDNVPTAGGVSGCSAHGRSSVPENLAAGAGTGNWSCTSGPLAGKGGTLTYVRAGAAVSVVLSGSVSGNLECEFSATGSFPPVVSYTLTCTGAAAA